MSSILLKRNDSFSLNNLVNLPQAKRFILWALSFDDDDDVKETLFLFSLVANKSSNSFLKKDKHKFVMTTQQRLMTINLLIMRISHRFCVLSFPFNILFFNPILSTWLFTSIHRLFLDKKRKRKKVVCIVFFFVLHNLVIKSIEMMTLCFDRKTNERMVVEIRKKMFWLSDVDLSHMLCCVCLFHLNCLNWIEMNLVRVNGSKGLISLWISVVSYFLALIIYVISFCLSDWIVYTSIPIKLGIWRLCDIEVFSNFIRSVFVFVVVDLCE